MRSPILRADRVNGDPYSGVLLRDDCKTDPSVKAIDREIAAVHCEDPPDAFSLSHSDKCRVREIHRAVGILDHELSYAWYVYQVEREEAHRPRANISQRASWAFGRSPSK